MAEKRSQFDPVPAELSKRPFWERLGFKAPDTFRGLGLDPLALLGQIAGGAGGGVPGAALQNVYSSKQAQLIRALGGQQALGSELVELQRKANELAAQQVESSYAQRAYAQVVYERDVEREAQRQQAEISSEQWRRLEQLTGVFSAGRGSPDPGVMLEDEPERKAAPRADRPPVLRAPGKRRLAR